MTELIIILLILLPIITAIILFYVKPATLKPVRLPRQKGCTFCKKKQKNMVPYYNDHGSSILVCTLCLEYAERRAYRRQR
ncbi:hypothetical protein [Bacillus alkalicellulosilyticus]|uniref:hypothetical protein n=1 Tax=Alkalihalobacterium alkalicellulosilyticum TaxID=1912214 RepID=UPI0009984AE5|nr:hypothetical protein [Bacillus alkalicellulosilyticus]